MRWARVFSFCFHKILALQVWYISCKRTHFLQQEDITGICQSVYNVRPEHQSSRSGANVLQVTKVRNYDLCQRRPKWQYGLMENIVFDPQEYKEQVREDN